MEYNNYNQGSSDTIICPQITVWILFALNCISVFGNASYLISFCIQLAIALCVTMGINKRNYNLYRVGLIISVIISTLGTIVLLYLLLLLTALINSKNSTKEENAALLIVIIIVAGVLIWLQSGILLCYRNKVEFHCGNMGGIGGLYNPQIQSPQIQPPMQTPQIQPPYNQYVV